MHNPVVKSATRCHAVTPRDQKPDSRETHYSIKKTALALSGSGSGSSGYLIETGCHRLGNIFILMWQKGQGIRDIVPLPFCLASRKTSGELLR